MKIIRWSFLSVTLIIIALIAIFNILFFDKILKNVIISSGQLITGAKVEIDYLKTSFTKCSIVINGLRCADRNDYFKNLIDVEKIKFDVRFAPVLRKKILIDEMSLEGLKWGTERKTSGKLPKKLEKKYDKQNKESKFSKLFSSAKTKTVEEFNSLPSVETFNKIEEQIKNFDINKIVEETGLSSIKEAEKLSSDLKNKYESYKTKFENINVEEKVDKTKTLIDEISKTKVSSLADISKTAKKVEELKTVKKEIEDILKELNNAKKDITATIDVSKQIKDSINNDIDTIYKKISLPNINTKNISQMLFGKKWVDRVEKIVYYISVIKQYMPEKSEKEVKEVKQRASGRDILFKETLYPSLLISKISVSGTSSKIKEDNTGVDFSGLIKNISSSPSMVNAPITLKLEGNNNIQKLDVAGTFDHRTSVSKDELKVLLTGLSGNILNIEPNDYLPLIDSADMDLTGSFNMNNDGFVCNTDISFKNIKEKSLSDVSGNMKYLVEITNSIKSFKVNLAAQTQDGKNLDMKISSDIDKKLYDAISKLFSSKISDVKVKIKDKVDAMVQEKIKDVEKSLQSQKDEILKQISAKSKSLEEINKDIAKSVKR